MQRSSVQIQVNGCAAMTHLHTDPEDFELVICDGILCPPLFLDPYLLGSSPSSKDRSVLADKIIEPSGDIRTSLTVPLWPGNL